MTAKDVISPMVPTNPIPEEKVTASMAFGQLIDLMVSRSLEAVAVVADDDSDVVIGVVDRQTLLAACARLFPLLQESTELTVICPPSQYSASAIAHAVEDADAHLLNLNVVAGTEPNSLTTVEIRVNHSRGHSVARSLMRYGYDTVTISSSDSAAVDDTTASRARNLLHLLEV